VRVVTIPGTGERFDLDRPGAVAAWNRALNRRYAMRNLRDHESALVRRIEARRRARLAALVPQGFDRALDLGAEDGALAGGWRGKGRFVLLLDVDPAMLRGAPDRRVAADALRLPLADRSFDVVVLSAILEHVVDPARAVAESVRVLRPGGRLVAYVPWDAAVVKVKRWARRTGFRLGPLHDGLAPGHLRVFDRARLRALFAAAASGVSVRLDPWSFGYYVEARA
jgi:SAM-dependent methyltransferase